MQEFVHATAIRHKAFSLSSTMGIPWNAFRNYLNLRKLAFNATGEKLWNRYSRAERRQDHPRTCLIPSEFRWTRRISLVTVSVRKTQWRTILLLISLTWCRGTLPVKVTTTKKKKKGLATKGIAYIDWFLLRCRDRPPTLLMKEVHHKTSPLWTRVT